MECLRAIRHELRDSYPQVRLGNLFRIMRSFGLRQFPEGLLVGMGKRGALWKLARAANPGRSRQVDWHPLFSSEFYLATNPDIAAAKVSPWLHYQVYGRAEGRSPHPLIDFEFLAASLPGARRDELVDEYLMSAHNWVLDPGPYVDCGRFMVQGEWDGYTNPLKQIVTHHLRGPWVHSRLMLVDTASESASRARLTAVSTLLIANAPASRFATVAYWQPNAEDVAGVAPISEAGPFTVIPGYFLGANDREIVSQPSPVVSSDSTMIRLASEFVSLISGRAISADALVYVADSLAREELTTLIRESHMPTAIAPHSAGQELALRHLCTELGRDNVTVLEFGKQVRVVSPRVNVARSAGAAATAEWAWRENVTADRLAVVLASAHRRRATNDPKVRELVARGAALCLVQPGDMVSWLPVLQTSATVLVDRSLREDVRGFVDDGDIYLLPGGEVGNQS